MTIIYSSVCQAIVQTSFRCQGEVRARQEDCADPALGSAERPETLSLNGQAGDEARDL